MPVNAGAEYFVAEKKYLEARTKEEKIAALEEMIRMLPKHKGSSHLLSELRHRLAKLKKESTKKTSAKPKFVIKKEGAAQVCIVGVTNSGKSTLLNSLTNANVEVGSYPFTTKKPEVGMADINDVQIQIIEIPSTLNTEFFSLLQTCNLILVLLDSSRNLEEQKVALKNITSKYENKILFIQRGIDLENLKKEIWNKLGFIKVYTKSPGKPKDLPALAFKPGATVEDVAKCVHKEFLKNFKFARIFNSKQDSGKKVGLEHELENDDVIEIHAG